jgi:CTP synthase
VISDPDVESIYHIPRVLEREGILKPMTKQLRLKSHLAMKAWNDVADRFDGNPNTVKIAMVGKYASLADSYVSVNQALLHAGAVNEVTPRISWVESEEFERDKGRLQTLEAFDGVVLPQGFGSRGVEGKIAAANHARVAGIPYLGLCFGFQLASVAFARHVLGFARANSTEVDPSTPCAVIDLLPEQKKVSDLGGTMRLGGHEVLIKKPSRAFEVYGRERIRERHRHRFEFNQEFLAEFEAKGMHYTAFSDGGRRAEILELDRHPFYMATQFHPEYISRPESPEPIYVAFVGACAKRAKETHQKAEKVATLSR